MNVNNEILRLIKYALDKNMIENEDLDYIINSMTYLLKLEETPTYNYDKKSLKQLSTTLDLILDYSFNIGLFSPNSTKQRDLFESRIMSVFSALPSSLNKTFHHLYKNSPIDATDYYYELSINNNYIKSSRISKNIHWQSVTKYGNIALTINLSKPEKDPRDIIDQANDKTIEYPKCVLCKENVGFYGNSNRPGRSNHRIIKINLNDEVFYLQYSPYVYYNEHSIVLMDKHIPMKVSIDTFKRLFDFVDLFPHYFLGSNAGLPIVGGSILSHEHYQGGKHHFPIEDAKIYKTYEIGDVKLHNVMWPISVVRLESSIKENIIDISNKVFEFWENYTNESIGIISHTDAPHNAITPIARKKDGIYFIDIALRNNLTSKEFPLGIYHTHPNNQHIKKENIGLIEVMGLAVLPARLKNELKIIKKCLINKTNLPSELAIHSEWLEELKGKYTNENIDKFINDQVAIKFVSSLEDAGVFKQTEEGIKEFSIFMDSLIDSIINK